jgi:hypothetical protein
VPEFRIGTLGDFFGAENHRKADFGNNLWENLYKLWGLLRIAPRFLPINASGAA